MNKANDNAEIRLIRRPGQTIMPEDFTLAATQIQAPQAGQVLVQVRWLSMDTLLYERTVGNTMGPMVELGTRMPGRGLATVVAGSLPAGTLVSGDFGWQQYATLDASKVVPLERAADLPETWSLSVLGAPGLTAWLALNEVLDPAAGKTLLVSGAAGTVGSLVGQLAKHMGLAVIGIAGGPEKCSWLLQQGYQAAIDRKTVGDWQHAISKAAPNGVDFYFDNAGGTILESVVQAIKPRGHIVLCGHSGEYTTGKTAQLTATDLLYKGLTVHGFRVWDHTARFGQARAALAELLRTQKLHIEENIHRGLASAPSALRAMLAGEGMGKHLVQVFDET